MAANMNKRLYIVSRESVVEARRLTDIDEQGEVLLVGRGLFLPTKLFGKKKIFAIEEEVKEQGLQERLAPNIKCLPAAEIVDLLFENAVLNFS